MTPNLSETPLPYECRMILADGTSLPGTVGEDESKPALWIRLTGENTDADKAAKIFGDPRKTGMIQSEIYSVLDRQTYKKSYTGYTKLSYIRKAGKQINILMTQPEAE